MVFDDRAYTFDAVVKQLGLVELHCKDGSAIDAGCQCIDTKHLYLIEGLAEEGKGFGLSVKEKQFYDELGGLMRNIRKTMEVEEFDLDKAIHSVSHAHNNPLPRKYLPFGLTACEKKHPSVVRKLAACIKELEPKQLRGEIKSAVAVCRASIKCPP